MDNHRAVVALQRWPELSDVDRVLERCLTDLGGMARFVKPGQRVVLKPNLTANAPADSGGATHVELVEALIRLVQPCQPGRIVVAEGTGAFGTAHETAFPTGGWREMAARTGVELFNLDHGPHQEMTLEKPRYPHPLPFSQLILDADVFITVPCLKTHLGCDYTVALKNAYGQTPQWKRSEIHAQGLLEEALVDLNRIRKPDLAVVDGYDGAEGIAGGMAFDRPAGARVLIAGADPVAVDVVSREIMGLTYPTRYLTWAVEKGVGVGDLKEIEIVGASLEECRHAFMSPAEELCLLAPELTIRDQKACSGCRSAALMTLSRLRYQKLRRPLTILYGGLGTLADPLEGSTLIVGECARRYAERCPGVGAMVEGCPARQEAVMEALQSLEVVCHQCLDLARQLVAEFPAPFKEYLRVTASGTRAFVGGKVRRDAWHLELLVGKCMTRFAHVVRERAPQFGLDPERDLVFLPDCPVPEPAVREALQRLERVAESPPPCEGGGRGR